MSFQVERGSGSDPANPSAGLPTNEYGLSRLWLVFRSNFWMIALLVIITTAVAVTATFVRPVTYMSTVTLVVRDPTHGDIETVTRTLGALLRSETVGEDLVSSTKLDISAKDIAKKISVERPPGSGVLEVNVTDTDLARSQQIARALVPAFLQRVNKQLGTSPDAPAVQTWDATPHSEEIPRPLARNGAVAIILGAMLAAFVIAVRERMSPAVASATQMETALGLPVLGALPSLSGRNGTAPLDAVRGIVAAAQRSGWPTTLPSILIAGPADARERGLFSLLVAVSLADAGSKVLLIDADGANGSLSRWLGLHDREGFSDVLRGEVHPDDVMYPVEAVNDRGLLRGAMLEPDSLFVVASGTGHHDSAMRNAAAVLKSYEKRNVVVVINGPTLPGEAPIWNLASSVGAVMAVIDEGTSVWDARATADLFHARGPMACAVMLSSHRLEVRAPKIAVHHNGNGNSNKKSPPSSRSGGVSRAQGLS